MWTNNDGVSRWVWLHSFFFFFTNSSLWDLIHISYGSYLFKVYSLCSLHIFVILAPKNQLTLLLLTITPLTPVVFWKPVFPNLLHKETIRKWTSNFWATYLACLEGWNEILKLHWKCWLLAQSLCNWKDLLLFRAMVGWKLLLRFR